MRLFETLASVFAVLSLAAGLCRADSAIDPGEASVETLVERLMQAANEGEDLADSFLTEAKQRLERALDKDSRNGAAHMGLAFIARERGEEGEARRRAKKATRHASDNAEFWHWRGNMIFENIDDVTIFSKGTMASAGRNAYQTAIELDPDHIDAHRALCVFYFRAPGIIGGSKEKSKKIAEKMLTLGPAGRYHGQLMLGYHAAGVGEWERMERAFAKAFEAARTQDERVKALREHASMLLEYKEAAEEALAVAERIREVAPEGSRVADLMSGLAHQQAGNEEQAIESFKVAVEKSSGGATALYELAESYRRAGRTDAAIETYKRFLREAPGDHEKRNEAVNAVQRLDD